MTYQIEKGVPLPPSRSGNGITAALRAMEVGDSILFPIEKASVFRRMAHQYFGKGNSATRNVEGGIRVWRLA